MKFISEAEKMNVLKELGNMVQQYRNSQKSVLAPSPEIALLDMVMINQLENAYADLERMLLGGLVSTSDGLARSATAMQLTRQQVKDILRRMMMSESQIVTLADDGHEFRALGTLTNNAALLLYSSESIQ